MARHTASAKSIFDQAITAVTHDGAASSRILSLRTLPLSSYVDGKPMKDQALNVAADALAKLWKRSAR
jgi:hypothetical protein